MQIIIQGKRMQVSPQLRQRIERKLQRLRRLVDEEARVDVTVSEEQTRSQQDRFSVHIALAGGSHPVYSEVSAPNATTALDLVLDKVVKQLGRQKDRQVTQRRQGDVTAKVFTLSPAGELSTLAEEDEEVTTAVSDEDNAAIWSQVREIRRLPTTPMDDQEVIAHMQGSGAAFYPFYNVETNSVNVMYKLEEGGYGLLVPAIEELPASQPR